jgi:hypothetical protein
MMAPNGDDIIITSIQQVFWCRYAELKEAEYNNAKEEIRQTQTRTLTDAPAFDNIRKAPRQSLYNLYEYKTSCQFLKRRIFVVVAERNLRVRFCFRFCCLTPRKTKRPRDKRSINISTAPPMSYLHTVTMKLDP